MKIQRLALLMIIVSGQSCFADEWEIVELADSDITFVDESAKNTTPKSRLLTPTSKLDLAKAGRSRIIDERNLRIKPIENHTVRVITPADSLQRMRNKIQMMESSGASPAKLLRARNQLEIVEAGLAEASKSTLLTLPKGAASKLPLLLTAKNSCLRLAEMFGRTFLIGEGLHILFSIGMYFIEDNIIEKNAEVTLYQVQSNGVEDLYFVRSNKNPELLISFEDYFKARDFTLESEKYGFDKAKLKLKD